MNVTKLFVLMIVALLAFNIVSASTSDLEVLYVKINGEEFDQAAVGIHDNNLQVEKGENLEIKVRVKALDDLSNVQVEVDIYGYEYSAQESELVSATSKTFDMSAGDVDSIDLDIQIPLKMDKKYTLLRIRVGDEDGISQEYIYQLHVVGVDEASAVIIKDYSFSPSSMINAGRAFTAMVRVQNIGDKDLDDVKVTIAIPDLNVRDSEYLDSLDADEKETLEEFLLRVPECTKPGVYDVVITVEFDEYESTTERTSIIVLEGDSCSVSAKNDDKDKTVVTVPGKQEVTAGNEIAYPIVISNEGAASKIFTVTISGVEDWGTSRVSPSSVVVVPAGETKTVFLYVKADEDASGEKIFIATVSSGADSESIPLTANVTALENNDGLKKGLEIALVVLVIILIIIGLIIGFNKLRSHDDEGTQTYY